MTFLYVWGTAPECVGHETSDAVFPEVSLEYQLPDPDAWTAKPGRHASGLKVLGKEMISGWWERGTIIWDNVKRYVEFRGPALGEAYEKLQKNTWWGQGQGACENSEAAGFNGRFRSSMEVSASYSGKFC